MTVRRKKILTTLMEWFLYIILVTGILYLAVVLGIAPSRVINGKLVFIIPHKIIGYLFIFLLMTHVFIHRKWYKAWTSGKIKNTKNNQNTKRITIQFLLMTLFFSFEGIFPRKLFALGHSAIGMTWILYIIYHIRIKRKTAHKSNPRQT